MTWCAAGIALAACNSAPAASSDGGRGGASAASQGSAGPPPTPDVVALLDGLKQSDMLGAVTVSSVSPVTRGAIFVSVTLGAQRGTLFVMNRGSTQHPPAAVGKYAVYYENEGADQTIPASTLLEACRALADRIRKTEARVPEPTGLSELTIDTNRDP